MNGATLDAMHDDLIRRRRNRLSPEAQALFDDINAAGEAGASVGGPEFEGFMERLVDLPPGERDETASLLTA